MRSPPAFLAPTALPRLTAGRRAGALAQSCQRASSSALVGSVAAGPGSGVARSLARAAELHERVGAFTTLDAGTAAASAEKRGKGGLLEGVAVAVKDNLCTEGMTTTAGSRILETYLPAYSATAVSRIEAAGGVVFGKTNMDEFGMGSSTENSAYGVTRNPWGENFVPGGSSGGSAAAVAAGICDFALGSDTGGSVRQPASFCGVTGLKPSYGRVSRHGLLAYASSLDTVGPITRTVADAARVLQVIAGPDPMDSTTVSTPVGDYMSLLADPNASSLEGLTVGVVTETLGDNVNSDVSDAVRAAVEHLKSLGAAVREVSLSRLAAATAAYYVLAPSEASANLARYDGVRYGVRNDVARNAADMYTHSRSDGFGAEVKRRICVGTYALSTGYYDAYYLRAQRVRALVRKDHAAVFDAGVDVLVSPVAPTTAFQLGEKTEDPTSMYAGDMMTIPASLAGLPALSVPCGLCSSGLPIGLQITGRYLDEATVLRVGHSFQLTTTHHEALSPIAKEYSKVASSV